MEIKKTCVRFGKPTYQCEEDIALHKDDIDLGYRCYVERLKYPSIVALAEEQSEYDNLCEKNEHENVFECIALDKLDGFLGEKKPHYRVHHEGKHYENVEVMPAYAASS